VVSIAKVVQVQNGWAVEADWGAFTETFGPYRWKWTANVVAWWQDGNL
jgi:hypothetical protein